MLGITGGGGGSAAHQARFWIWEWQSWEDGYEGVHTIRGGGVGGGGLWRWRSGRLTSRGCPYLATALIGVSM